MFISCPAKFFSSRFNIKILDFLVELSYDHSFISFFCWYMGEPFWSCNCFINLPLKLFNFNFMFFFLKNILILNLGKTVYPPSPKGPGGIIRSKIGSKRVDLILIRLAKCWNNFFSSKFCENVKSEYFFFSPVQPNFFQRFRIKIKKKNI
jgi:hypothetical protein